MNLQDIQDDITHNQELISSYKRSLRILELQASKFGIHVPPYIQIEIEVLYEQINRCEKKIEGLEQDCLIEIECKRLERLEQDQLVKLEDARQKQLAILEDARRKQLEKDYNSILVPNEPSISASSQGIIADLYRRRALLQATCHQLTQGFGEIISSGQPTLLLNKIPEFFSNGELKTRHIGHEDLAIFQTSPIRGIFHVSGSSTFDSLQFVYYKFFSDSLGPTLATIVLAQRKVDEDNIIQSAHQLFSDAIANNEIQFTIKNDVNNVSVPIWRKIFGHNI